MKAVTLIQVSNISESGLYTFEAYKELRLQLSTGDFGVHKYEILERTEDTQYWDFADGEFYLINEATG